MLKRNHVFFLQNYQKHNFQSWSKIRIFNFYFYFTWYWDWWKIKKEHYFFFRIEKKINNFSFFNDNNCIYNSIFEEKKYYKLSLSLQRTIIILLFMKKIFIMWPIIGKKQHGLTLQKCLRFIPSHLFFSGFRYSPVLWSWITNNLPPLFLIFLFFLILAPAGP